MKGSLVGRLFKEAGWAGVHGPLMEKAAHEILRLTAELDAAHAQADALRRELADATEAQGEDATDSLALELRGVISDLSLCVDAMEGRDGADVAMELAIAQMRLREIDARFAARRGEGGGE